jgi:hypothetical protein
MKKVFVKKTENQNFNVATSIGLSNSRLKKGTIGIEIEVEGNVFRKVNLPSPWTYKPDGSLRGNDNAEYVFSSPDKFEAVDKALSNLWAMFKADGSILDDSNRTSVHVHLNVQDFYLNRLTALMALYFVFEEILTEWCGEYRVGNMFCLRAKDAPSIVSQLRRFIRHNMESPLREGNHYSGLNSSSIFKYGSLEFRALRGVKDPEVIRNWVAILRRLYELSESFPDPRVIVRNLSSIGPLAYFEAILGDTAKTVRDGIKMTEDEVRDSLYEGVRLAQDLCYARNWDTFKVIEIKPDPFNRSAKTVIRRMSAQQNDVPPETPETVDGEFPDWIDEQMEAQIQLHTEAMLQTAGAAGAAAVGNVLGQMNSTPLQSLPFTNNPVFLTGIQTGESEWESTWTQTEA